jgi:hypothetical protein
VDELSVDTPVAGITPSLPPPKVLLTLKDPGGAVKGKPQGKVKARKVAPDVQIIDLDAELARPPVRGAAAKASRKLKEVSLEPVAGPSGSKRRERSPLFGEGAFSDSDEVRPAKRPRTTHKARRTTASSLRRIEGLLAESRSALYAAQGKYAALEEEFEVLKKDLE